MDSAHMISTIEYQGFIDTHNQIIWKNNNVCVSVGGGGGGWGVDKYVSWCFTPSQPVRLYIRAMG